MTQFIDSLQVLTTSNYSATSNSQTQEFTTARTKSFKFVFTCRFLITDPNNVLRSRPCWLANVTTELN
jgi:hypothetical protein